MVDKHHQFPDYPFLFGPIDAAAAGNESRPGFGEWLEPFGLRIWAKTNSVVIPDDKIPAVLERMRETMRWTNMAPTDAEIRAMVAKVRAPAGK